MYLYISLDRSLLYSLLSLSRLALTRLCLRSVSLRLRSDGIGFPGAPETGNPRFTLCIRTHASCTQSFRNARVASLMCAQCASRSDRTRLTSPACEPSTQPRSGFGIATTSSRDSPDVAVLRSSSLPEEVSDIPRWEL